MKLNMLLTVLCALLIAAPVLAQENPFDSQYAITTWDHPGPINTVLTGINDSEQIVGYIQYGFYLSTLGAFLKEGDYFSDIGGPNYSPTIAAGVNNLGQFVGYYLELDFCARRSKSEARGG